MENSGEQFLHQRDQKLHISKPVEHEQKRRGATGDVTSQKPADKIASWLEIIERTHMGHRDNPRVLEQIKRFYHREYVIQKSDIPENYFENQRRMARELGHGDIQITPKVKRELSKTIIMDQESSLDMWVDYLSSSDTDGVPTWVKYWAFSSIVKMSNFDKEKHTFGKRDKGTVAPFPDLNPEALSYVLDLISKRIGHGIDEPLGNPELEKILETANFSKLYAYSLEKATLHEEAELKEPEGEWRHFPKGSDHKALVSSLQGFGTGWCTAGEEVARHQLAVGDMYIFYAYDKSGTPRFPRAAIRREGDENDYDSLNIVEVRGVAKDQNLDPQIGSVVEKELKRFRDGEVYERKISDMKMLTEIERKIDNQEDLDERDLRFIYEFDRKIQGFGHTKDPRIGEILNLRNPRRDISKITGYPLEMISTNEDEALEGDIKYHFGNLELAEYTDAMRLNLPEIVDGDLDLSGIIVADGLHLPNEVRGNLELLRLISIDGLKLPRTVRGEVAFVDITTEALESLQSRRPDLRITLYPEHSVFRGYDEDYNA